MLVGIVLGLGLGGVGGWLGGRGGEAGAGQRVGDRALGQTHLALDPNPAKVLARRAHRFGVLIQGHDFGCTQL